jgi:ribonuclease P protein component
MREACAEGLSRRHRFTVQGSFGPILRNPRKFRSPHAVLHVTAGKPGISRFGIALARRQAPLAVQRNRFKRALREAFRRHAVKRAGLDLVVSLRSRFEREEEPELVREVVSLFDQALRPPLR